MEKCYMKDENYLYLLNKIEGHIKLEETYKLDDALKELEERYPFVSTTWYIIMKTKTNQFAPDSWCVIFEEYLEKLKKLEGSDSQINECENYLNNRKNLIEQQAAEMQCWINDRKLDNFFAIAKRGGGKIKDQYGISIEKMGNTYSWWGIYINGIGFSKYDYEKMKTPIGIHVEKDMSGARIRVDSPIINEFWEIHATQEINARFRFPKEHQEISTIIDHINMGFLTYNNINRVINSESVQWCTGVSNSYRENDLKYDCEWKKLKYRNLGDGYLAMLLRNI